MTIGGEGIELIGQGAPDGATFGYSTTEKISFYGVTPVVQQTAINAKSASTAIGGATTTWAFTSSSQANILIQDVHDMHYALVAYGLLDQ
jgi:hypothetical protein